MVTLVRREPWDLPLTDDVAQGETSTEPAIPVGFRPWRPIEHLSFARHW
jgi:hypothetical protein